MIEKLKQRILAIVAKVSRYEQRIQQHKINRLFNVDQKKVYNEFNKQTGSRNGTYGMLKEAGCFGLEFGGSKRKE